MAEKKKWQLDDLTGDVPAANAGGGSENAPTPTGKFDEAGTVGGSIVDFLSGGNADNIVSYLKRLGLATDQAATQTTKEAMAENPKSAMLGTGLAMAVPVAGAEALLGKAGVLAGEKILPAIARGGLASGGVSAANQAGRAATGNETDWTAPLYDAAFGGLFSGAGRAAGRALTPAAEKAARTVREAVPGVPKDFKAGPFRSDPVAGPGNIGEVGQTAPEALKAAGLGDAAADAERLLRRTIGGAEPVVPGREAKLAAGQATRETASSAAEDAAIAAHGKTVNSPFGATPDLQNIHFQTAGQRPPGSSTLFDYASTLEKAQAQAAGNPALKGQIDTALGDLAQGGRPEIGNLFGAHAAEKQFGDFAGGFGVTPSPTPKPGGLARKAASMGVDVLSDLIPGGGVIRAGARLVGEHGLDRIFAKISGGAPPNAQMIESILMDPMKFSSVLQPQELAQLIRYRQARALGAGALGAAPGHAAQGRDAAIKREFGPAY